MSAWGIANMLWIKIIIAHMKIPFCFHNILLERDF